MMNLRKFACLIVLECLIWAVPIHADVVTDWNLITVQTVLAVPAERPGPTSILDLAMVHAAMHDAIQAYNHQFETYAAPILNASGSAVAAAATAAHDVLAKRLPSQAGNLDTLLTNYLGALMLLGDPGVGVGQVAAARIITLRVGDGSFPSNFTAFFGGNKPGEWRPTLPNPNAPMLAPWLASVVPFTLKDSTQLRASPPPPQLTSGEYAHDYNEVKTLGRINSTERTPEQTALANFYNTNF